MVTTNYGSTFLQLLSKIFSAIERNQIKALPASDFETAGSQFQIHRQFWDANCMTSRIHNGVLAEFLAQFRELKRETPNNNEIFQFIRDYYH